MPGLPPAGLTGLLHPRPTSSWKKLISLKLQRSRSLVAARALKKTGTR